MHRRPPRFVQVGTLPPDEQTAAVAWLDAHTGPVGPVSAVAVPVRPTDVLPCGCPRRYLRMDGETEYCGACQFTVIVSR